MPARSAQPESGFLGCLLAIKDWVLSGMICVFVVIAWASFLEMLTPLMPSEQIEATILDRRETRGGSTGRGSYMNYRLRLQFQDGTEFSTLVPKDLYRQWPLRIPVLVERVAGTSKITGISKADRSESHSLLSGGFVFTLLIMVLPCATLAAWLFWKVRLRPLPGVEPLRLPVFFTCLAVSLVGGTLWWLVD